MIQLSPHAHALRVVFVAAALACVIPTMQVSASPLDWVTGEKIQGNGTIKKQSRELAHFTGVSLALPANLELRLGNSENNTIETDENLLAEIETVIENGVLQIRPVKRNANLRARTIKILVNARNVERLALGGSGSIDSDALRASKLQFDLGGSGSIRLKGMEGDAVSVNVGGSGNLKSGAGTADSLSVSIGGSGNVDLGQVRVRDVSVSVAGSGEAVIWADNALKVTIAGSGDVNYYGQPKLSHTVIGSGTTRQLGIAPRN